MKENDPVEEDLSRIYLDATANVSNGHVDDSEGDAESDDDDDNNVMQNDMHTPESDDDEDS